MIGDNITKIIPSIPKFGKWQEIIFVEGSSHDRTWEKINNLKFKIKNVGFRTIKAYRQRGKGKADAVWLGFGLLSPGPSDAKGGRFFRYRSLSMDVPTISCRTGYD